MKRFLTCILVAAAALLSAKPLCAQTVEDSYKFDFGAQLGMSGYLGDANASNMFKHPGVEAGLSFRYLSESRWAIRTSLNVMTLSGNSADFSNVYPGGETYEFKSTVFDLGARFEYDFFPYGIGETYKKLRRWTPYLAVGVGVSLSTCGGQTAFAPNIPMAFGVRYKLRPRLNIAAEFSMTKVFGDRIDGMLEDLYEIESSMIKNTDWYANILISISYEFGKRCVTCHYVD